MATGPRIDCIGCDTPLDDDNREAAFAIMHEEDFRLMFEADHGLGGIPPHVKGTGKFVAGPVCRACHTDPAHRKRTLKAHFALPGDVMRLLGRAGSSSIG